MQTLSQIISQMVKEKRLDIREPNPMSWGDHEQCRRGFTTIFCEVDTTFDNYQHLPEYEEVIDWMTDTKDQGLLLMGDCGRGKSIIISGVIPVLLRLKNRWIRIVHSQELTKPTPSAQVYYYGQRPETNLDYLLKTPFPIIDELGVESLVNDYGEKSEGFNLIMNAAERYHRPIFATTNLTKKELLERYGERTLDRLGHLCRIVEFKGESLR
jgi:DNA replication protein DnaC